MPDGLAAAKLVEAWKLGITGGGGYLVHLWQLTTMLAQRFVAFFVLGILLLFVIAFGKMCWLLVVQTFSPCFYMSGWYIVKKFILGKLPLFREISEYLNDRLTKNKHQ